MRSASGEQKVQKQAADHEADHQGEKRIEDLNSGACTVVSGRVHVVRRMQDVSLQWGMLGFLEQ